MTKEQIKQNAHDYTYTNDHNWTWDDSGESRVDISAEISDAYIAGAHSMLEEIKELNGKLVVKDIELMKSLTEQALLQSELNQLRNPWISVEKRLPAPRKDTCFSENCLVLYKDQEIGISYITEAYYDFGYKGNGGWVLTFNDNEHFFYSDYQENGCIVTHWMPIPQIKKGE